MKEDSGVFFTVIIPTRNRVELFELALKSVLEQSFKNYEIIVVNDGSDDHSLEKYRQLESRYPSSNIKFRYQIRRPNGHGQSYSMNTGAYVGSGKYLCFLDDDDFWTDSDHLKNAYHSIFESDTEVDAYYTNQVAYFSDGVEQKDNVWIEDLSERLNKSGEGAYGAYPVTVPFLLSSGGFAHLNCSIVRRQLYLDIKGMDENIRYECDRDIYIRTIDAAKHILYNPNVVSQHHIPDKKKKDNMSTLVSDFEKYLYQINVYEKAVLQSQCENIRDYSKLGLSYIYKKIAMIYVEQGEYRDSKEYARKALAVSPSVKWRVYCLWLSVRSKL